MKGIALITIVFLPATFVSVSICLTSSTSNTRADSSQTFFAMPIMNFSVDSRLPYVKDTFWLYWAVTVPLTAVVLASYIAFRAMLNKRHRREDQKLDVHW